MNNKNSEGYQDTTASKVINKVTRQEDKATQDKITRLIHSIKSIVELSGFEIVGRITLKEKKSGRLFK